MQYNFKDRITQNLSTNLTSTDVLESIVSCPDSPIKNQIELIRNGNNSLKQELPVYYFNCSFNNLEAQYSNIQNLTGEIFLDIDKLPTIEILQETKQNIEKLQFVKACWLSSSGNGLHTIVKVDNLTFDNFNSTWDMLNIKYFNSMLDIKCRNINRATFLSHDENAYINPNPIALDIKSILSTLYPIPYNYINVDTHIGAKDTFIDSSRFENTEFGNFKRIMSPLIWTPLEALRQLGDKESVVFDKPIYFFSPFKTSIKIGQRKSTLIGLAAYIMTFHEHFTINNLLFWLDDFNKSYYLGQSTKDINGVAVSIFKQLKAGKFIKYYANQKPKKGMISLELKKNMTKGEKCKEAAKINGIVRSREVVGIIEQTLEDLFQEDNIITIELLASKIRKSKGRTQKYYKQFKQQIKEMNEDIRKRILEKSKEISKVKENKVLRVTNDVMIEDLLSPITPKESLRNGKEITILFKVGLTTEEILKNPELYWEEFKQLKGK